MNPLACRTGTLKDLRGPGITCPLADHITTQVCSRAGLVSGSLPISDHRAIEPEVLNAFADGSLGWLGMVFQTLA